MNEEEKENEEAADQSCPWRSFGFTLIHTWVKDKGKRILTSLPKTG